MEGFLSDRIRDVLNVLGLVSDVIGIILGLLGIALTILLALYSPKQVFEATRACCSAGKQALLELHKLLQRLSTRTQALRTSELQDFTQVSLKTKLTYGLLALVVICVVPLAFVERFELSPGQPEWNNKRLSQAKPKPVSPCGKLEYRITRNEEDNLFAGETVELFCKDQRVYQADAWYLTLRGFDDEGESAVALGPQQKEVRGTMPAYDITGDGMADILLSTHNGGSCCGPEHELISLGTNPHKMVKIAQTKYEEDAQFEDLDGDGIFEIRRDDVLVRDYGSHADAFATFPVILAVTDGAYKLNAHLMRRTPPSERELLRMSKSLLAVGPDEQRRAVYRYLMELTYGGNGYQARRLLELVSSNLPDGEHFIWREFKGMLSNSDYWPEIAAMNGWDRELSEFAGESCSY